MTQIKQMQVALPDVIAMMSLPDELRNDAANYLRQFVVIEAHRTTADDWSVDRSRMFKIIDGIRATHATKDSDPR